MFPRDRRHLRSRHQTLRGDLRLLRGRTIATPSRPLNHLKPTDAARLRDVQLDVHFAVCNHTATSLIRGQLCTLLSCSARGDQPIAYVPNWSRPICSPSVKSKKYSGMNSVPQRSESLRAQENLIEVFGVFATQS